MRRVAAMTMAVAFVVGTSLIAQTKPNFAGKWTRDADKTAAANPAPPAGGGGGGGRGGGGGGGGTIELKQDATTLTRIQIQQDGTAGTPAVYKLDGTESKNTMAGRGGAAGVEVVSKATWVGNTISIETSRPAQDGSMVKSTTVYSMEGDWLVIAQTNPGREGGAPTTTKTYYKKAA